MIAHKSSLLSVLPAYDFVKHVLAAHVLLRGSHMAQAVIAIINARFIAAVPGANASIAILHSLALAEQSKTIECAEAVLTLLQGLLNVEGKC